MLLELNNVVTQSRRDDNLAKLFKSCTKWFEKQPLGLQCNCFKRTISIIAILLKVYFILNFHYLRFR